MDSPDLPILKTPDPTVNKTINGRRILLRGFTEADESPAIAFVNSAGGQLV